MKKFICLLLLALIMTFSCTGVFAQQDITVVLDGEILKFDQNPVIIDGRTLVPLRGIFEPMGATVGWDDATRTVTAVKDDTTIKLTIGEAILYKNGEAIILDVPAQLIGSRTMVPARAVAEAFDAKVGWIEDAWAVTVVTDELLKEAITKLENADELALAFMYNTVINGAAAEVYAEIGINKKLGVEYLESETYYLSDSDNAADDWILMVSDANKSYFDVSAETELKNEPIDIVQNKMFDLLLQGLNVSCLEYEDDDVAIYSDGSEAAICIYKDTKAITLEMPGSEVGMDGLTDETVVFLLIPDSGRALQLQKDYLN